MLIKHSLWEERILPSAELLASLWTQAELKGLKMNRKLGKGWDKYGTSIYKLKCPKKYAYDFAGKFLSTHGQIGTRQYGSVVQSTG